MSTRDHRDTIEDQDEDTTRHHPPACEMGMTGWCDIGNHVRCYVSTPEGAAAYRAGTYVRTYQGHRWLCPCVCHAEQDLPECPHPDHPTAAGC